MSKITVLEVQPLKKPKVRQIPSCETLIEKELGGHIEVKTPVEGDRQIAIISNADSALQERGMCRAIYTQNIPTQIEEIIMGTFFIAQIDNTGQLASLTDKQIAFYTERFQKPEIFKINRKGHLVVCRLEDDNELLTDVNEDTGQELRDFWDGTNTPRNQMVESDEYKFLLKKVCKAMNELNCVSPESMDELFEAYIEAEHNLSKWCEKDAFAKGIAIGKKLRVAQ